jgi:hypothetical protein
MRTDKVVLSFIFYVCFALTVVILVTDQNLQTNFGAVKPYFIHWYGLLITGLVDLIGGVLFLVRRNPPLFVANIWFVFMPIFMVADTLTYAEVFFNSPAQFAVYLFGFKKFPGTLAYIPGLFDVLFALYILGFLACVLVRRKRLVTN